MHPHHPRNLRESPSVQIIGRQDQPVLWGNLKKHHVDSLLHASIRRNGGDILRLELLTRFRPLVKAHQAALASIAVDIFLREHGPEPAFERAPSRIRREFRDALATPILPGSK